MVNSTRWLFVGLLVFFSLGLSLANVATVDKWRRHVISMSNSTYSANPFKLEIDATFPHTKSETTVTLPGYYAGNDNWKRGFMPTKTGE